MGNHWNWPSKGRFVIHYAVAPVTVALALACRLALNPILEHHSPFMYFFVAILVSGWLGGLVPALAATVLSALAVSYFYLPPLGSLALATPQEMIQFGSFLVLGAVVSLIASQLRQDRERAEAAGRQARENQQRLGGIVESAMDAIISVDEAQKIVLFNIAAERIFRCPAASALGSPLDRFIPDRFRAIHRQHVKDFGATGQTARAMGHLRPLSALRADGEEFPIEASISQVHVAGQQIFTVILRDITARMQAEEALRQSEAQLKTIVDNLSEGLVVADMEGMLVHWNRAALEMHGYSNLEECRRKLPYLTDSFELANLDGTVLAVEQWPLARILRGETLRDLDLRIRRLDHSWQRIFSYSGTAVRDEHGTPFLGVITINDVTVRKQIEEELDRRVQERTAQLEALNAKLELSNRELQDFAFVASHDLQEPLRKISAFGDCLAGEYGPILGETGADYLQRMQAAARRMQKLISDLLQLSRVTSKAQPFTAVDLKQVIDGVLNDLEVRIRDSGARLEVGPMPTLEADPSQMRQLLQNLIGNALKFIRTGVQPLVRIYSESVENSSGENSVNAAPGKNGLQFRLLVADNGIGFDEKYLDRIFTVFQRLHERGQYEGTGVGLAICRKITERHHGSITAHSRLGEGSTFIVTLPFTQNSRRSVNDG